MHEGSIAQGLIDGVLDELSERNLSGSVESVVFSAGKMSSVVPEVLTFYFDYMKLEHEILKEATLRVEEIPVVVSCSTCQKEFEIEEPLFLCETCGNAVSMKTGKEMYLSNITLTPKEG